MQYFVGVVPSEAIRKRVMAFQKQFPGNRLQDMVEPHITVKAQGGLDEGRSWMAAIEEAMQDCRPFDVSLDGVSSFAGVATFLKPAPQGELRKLHLSLVAAVNPSDELIRKYFENEAYHPHLTLGMTGWGMTAEDLKQMEERAHHELNDLPTFNVSFIRIYQQSHADGPYEKLLDVPFGAVAQSAQTGR